MAKTLEKTTLAGGCFWCTEAIFKRLKGVISVTPGYAGGREEKPTWENVYSGKTGHAESIQIVFNLSIISFETILEVFWKTHDPTSLNRQDHDVGEAYRSVIFYHNEDQKDRAEDSKKKLEESGYYPNPFVTQIIPFTNFYPAGKEHLDFYDRNRGYSYCQIIIDPKIQKLLKEFTGLTK